MNPQQPSSQIGNLGTSRSLFRQVTPDPESLKELLISHHADVSMNEEEFSQSVDHFQELMSCFICFSPVKEPVMCPSCSKFACETCLKNWIIDRKAECPACRTSLGLSQYVRIRFLNDLSSILEKLTRNQSARAIANSNHIDPLEICEEHKIKFQYFCLTCSKSVCADCVMFTNNHEKHQFERMKSILEKKVEAISESLLQLKSCIGEYANYSKELSFRLDELKKAKEEKVDELMSAYRMTKSRLDLDFSARSQKINEEKNKVEICIQTLEGIYAEIFNQVKNGSIIRTINRNADYQNIINDEIASSFKPSIPSNIVSDLGSEIVIKAGTASFVLKNFSQMKAKNEIVFSDPLVADGITWRAKIYPNGTGVYKGMYLSVFVEMVKGWEGGGSYYYKVILIKPGNESENIEREYTSEYENSICWGYNRFCKLEDLETQGFWNKESDQIELKYVVRAANHAQKVKDLSCYISTLEEQLKDNRQRNQSRAPRLTSTDLKEAEESPDSAQKNQSPELEGNESEASGSNGVQDNALITESPSMVFLRCTETNFDPQHEEDVVQMKSDDSIEEKKAAMLKEKKS